MHVCPTAYPFQKISQKFISIFLCFPVNKPTSSSNLRGGNNYDNFDKNFDIKYIKLCKQTERKAIRAV